MSVLAPPLLRRPGAPLARANPVAKLGDRGDHRDRAAADRRPAHAGARARGRAALPAADRPATCARCSRRTWPLLFAAGGHRALERAVLGRQDRCRCWSTGGSSRSPPPARRTASRSPIRVLAIALPGVLALATTDPTDLADALVQQLHLPWRFAIGALAAHAAAAADGRRVADRSASPGAPAGSRRVAHRCPRSGCSARRRSPCWSARSGAASGCRSRWRPAASARRPGRTYARQQRMRRDDWLLLAAAVVVVLAATATTVALGDLAPRAHLITVRLVEVRVAPRSAVGWLRGSPPTSP